MSVRSGMPVMWQHYSTGSLILHRPVHLLEHHQASMTLAFGHIHHTRMDELNYAIWPACGLECGLDRDQCSSSSCTALARQPSMKHCSLATLLTDRLGGGGT